MSRERMDTEEFAALVAAPLKAKLPLSPEFDAKVMAAVAEAATPWWKRRLNFSVSPIGGLALAAGISAIMLLAGMGVERTRVQPGVAQADTVHLVRFVIAAPGAQSVAVAGDFNGWSRSATPLEQLDGNGQWTVTLPLSAGRHEYAFVVDGERWVPDPFATAARDEFGQVSSVLRVGGDPLRGA